MYLICQKRHKNHFKTLNKRSEVIFLKLRITNSASDKNPPLIRKMIRYDLKISLKSATPKW